MPNNVLNQLKTLRDGVAEELRRDPRYQTLQALDKSIAEITNVLAAAGLLPPTKAASSLSTRLSGLAPSTEALAEPTGGTPQQQISAAPPFTPAPVASAPESPAAEGTGFAPTPAPPNEPITPADSETTKPGFKDGTVSQTQAAVPGNSASLLKPAAGLAAALIAGGVVAEVVHERSGEPHGHAPSAEDADLDAIADEADEAHGAAEAESEEPPAPLAQLGPAPGHAETEPHAEAELRAESEPHAEFHPVAASADATEPHVLDSADEEAEEDSAATEAGSETAPFPEATEEVAAVVPEGKASGYVPMAAKPGAPQYAPSIAVKFGKLPNKVDLRPLMTPVEDQGEVSSCVANAVAGAYEYWIKKASKKEQTISRLFVYYNARWRDGSQDNDGGSAIQLAMEGLQKFGACAETAWPSDPRLVLKRPDADAYQNGAPYRVHDMAQVPLKLESWKQALAEGKPIVFGIELFGSFNQCTGRGGVVPMPAPDDLARKKHGGHSLCAVGYSESEKVFIVRNSWGAAFGDAGYCYMPFDYVLNPKLNDSDCWVFVPKVPSQPPRETWGDDTTPVTNGGRGVDFVIQPYSVADYEQVAVDLFAAVRRPWNGTVPVDYGEYVSAVSKSLFTELESFDVRALLASTAIVAGAGVSAAAVSGSFANESPHSISETSPEESQSTSDREDEKHDAEEDEENDAEGKGEHAGHNAEDDADEEESGDDK